MKNQITGGLPPHICSTLRHGPSIIAEVLKLYIDYQGIANLIQHVLIAKWPPRQGHDSEKWDSSNKNTRPGRCSIMFANNVSTGGFELKKPAFRRRMLLVGNELGRYNTKSWWMLECVQTRAMVDHGGWGWTRRDDNGFFLYMWLK